MSPARRVKTRTQPCTAELAIKNDAENGLVPISRAKRDVALRQARKLVEVAETVLQR